MDQTIEASEQAGRAKAVSAERSDLFGKFMGFLVFLLGVGLLLLVFKIAYELFAQKPDAALGLKFTGDPKKDPAAAQIGAHFGTMLFQLAYLFIMSIAGSLIAQKGVNLYCSAMRGKPSP